MFCLSLNYKYAERRIRKARRRAKFLIENKKSLVVCLECGSIWLPNSLYMNGIHGPKHYRKHCPYCGSTAKISYEKACEEKFKVKLR